MKGNRNTRLLISLGVMTIIAAGVYFLQQKPGATAVDPALFRVPDVSAINHVAMESRGKKIDLKYAGSQWRLDEKFDADDQLVKVLMATVLQITPRRPVAAQQRDSVSRQLLTTGTKVSLFTEQGLVREFLAGGNAARTEAYFEDPGERVPYIMTIPGYRVYASGVFELTESDWRDKRIFNFNWRNFRELTLAWPRDPASGFEFIKQKDFLGIVGLENPDSTRVNNFLNDVLTLTADQIAAPRANPRYDSLMKTPPIVTITVNDLGRHRYTLELFAQLKGENKVAGKAWDGEIVVFERRKLFPILKKKDYFKVK